MNTYRVQVTRLQSYDVAVPAANAEDAKRTAVQRVKHGYEEPDSEDFETSTATRIRGKTKEAP